MLRDLRRELASRLRKLVAVAVKKNLETSRELVSKRSRFHRLGLCTVRATFIVGPGRTTHASRAYDAQRLRDSDVASHTRRVAPRALLPLAHVMLVA